MLSKSTSTSTSTSKVNRYDLIHFHSINIDGLSLDDKILDILNKLNNKVSAPNYKKTPNFKKKNKKSNNDWNAVRSFKVTDLKKTDQQNKYHELNTELNKLTNFNYEDIIDFISNYIDKHDDNNIYILNYLIDLMFNNSKKNKGLSITYTKIYISMVNKYEYAYKDINDKHLDKYMNSLNNILDVNDESNYIDFCNENKKKDKRINLLSYFIELYNYGLINENSILNIIYKIFNIIELNIIEEEKINKVEELIQHMLLILDNSKNIKQHVKYNQIINKLSYIGGLNVDEYPSLTYKIIFKIEHKLKNYKQ